MIKYTIKSFLKIIMLFIILLMLQRIYINDINKNLITGSDKFMIDLNRNSYCIGRFELNVNNDKLWDITKKRVKNYIDKNKDIFKYYDFKEKKIKINYDLTLDDICIETEKDLNEYLNDENIHKNMGVFYVYNREKRYFDFVINHILYDYQKGSKFLKLIYFNPCENLFQKMPNYSYLPIFNELVTMYTIFKFSKFYRISNNNNLRNFNIEKNRFIIKTYTTNIYDNFKKIKKYKSSEISLALTCLHIFKSLKVKIKTFNIAYLLGFKNDRFNNNYTCILLQIKVELDFFKIIDNIKKEIKSNIINSIGIYDLLNYSLLSNLQTNSKKNIHMQFSNIYDNNKYYKSGYFIVDRTSTPFYVTSSCINNLNTICFQYNTIDIDENKLNEEIEHYI